MIPRAIVRLTVLALSILATSVVSVAQQLPGSPRIGVLSSSSPEREQGYLAAFQQSLRDLGYSEGKNLLIDRRYAAGKFDTLPELAAELVRLKVDILVVTGTPAAHAAKNATPLIPIVTVTAADPVATGLVTSLARPGGNVTGLTDLAPGLVAKRPRAHQRGDSFRNSRRRVAEPGQLQQRSAAAADPGSGIGARREHPLRRGETPGGHRSSVRDGASEACYGPPPHR